MAAILVQSKRARAARVRNRAKEAARAIEQILMDCEHFEVEFNRPPVESYGPSPWQTFEPGGVIYVSMKVFPKPGK